MSQVERISAKFGGQKRLADSIGLHYSAVSQMKRRRGLIPVKHHQAIIDAARQRGIEITPNDFFDPPSNSKRRSRKLEAAQ